MTLIPLHQIAHARVGRIRLRHFKFTHPACSEAGLRLRSFIPLVATRQWAGLKTMPLMQLDYPAINGFKLIRRQLWKFLENLLGAHSEYY